MGESAKYGKKEAEEQLGRGEGEGSLLALRGWGHTRGLGVPFLISRSTLLFVCLSVCFLPALLLPRVLTLWPLGGD